MLSRGLWKNPLILVFITAQIDSYIDLEVDVLNVITWTTYKPHDRDDAYDIYMCILKLLNLLIKF